MTAYMSLATGAKKALNPSSVVSGARLPAYTWDNLRCENDADDEKRKGKKVIDLVANLLILLRRLRRDGSGLSDGGDGVCRHGEMNDERGGTSRVFVVDFL